MSHRFVWRGGRLLNLKLKQGQPDGLQPVPRVYVSVFSVKFGVLEMHDPVRVAGVDAWNRPNFGTMSAFFLFAEEGRTRPDHVLSSPTTALFDKRLIRPGSASLITGRGHRLGERQINQPNVLQNFEHGVFL
jgi:hypothetical protein